MEMTAVKIPNESLKAQLIGRDAGNIRAFREATGVELVIDNSPNQVYLKSPDNEKLQAARRALESMIHDKQFKKEKILEYAKLHRTE